MYFAHTSARHTNYDDDSAITFFGSLIACVEKQNPVNSHVGRKGIKYKFHTSYQRAKKCYKFRLF